MRLTAIAFTVVLVAAQADAQPPAPAEKVSAIATVVKTWRALPKDSAASGQLENAVAVLMLEAAGATTARPSAAELKAVADLAAALKAQGADPGDAVDKVLASACGAGQAEAKANLKALLAAERRYFSQAHQYENDPARLGFTPQGARYKVLVVKADAKGFEARATGVGDMQGDEWALDDVWGSAENKKNVCAPQGASPSRAGPDTWPGVYALKATRPALGQLAVVAAHGPGEYWLVEGGYLLPAKGAGNALVALPLPKPASCPWQARDCTPPASRFERVTGGVRVDSRTYSEHASSAFLRKLPDFQLVGSGPRHRVRYQNGLLTMTLPTDRAETCIVGIPVPSAQAPAVRKSGWVAQAVVVVSAHDQATSDCNPIDFAAQHTVNEMPGLALVSNGAGKVVGAYLVAYMFEELFLTEPLPPLAEQATIAKLAALALGTHPGEAAE
jgi:hypothetical protein